MNKQQIAHLNNKWLKLNERLGGVMSLLVSLKKDENKLRDEMLNIEATLHGNNLEAPVSWKEMDE